MNFFSKPNKTICSYPYDWRKPVTYLAATTLLSIILTISHTVYCSSLALFCGMCEIFFTFYTDMEQILIDLDQEIQWCSKLDKTKQANARRIIGRKFIEFVEFHGDMQQLGCLYLCYILVAIPIFIRFLVYYWIFSFIRFAAKCSSAYNHPLALFVLFGPVYWTLILLELNAVSTQLKIE